MPDGGTCGRSARSGVNLERMPKGRCLVLEAEFSRPGCASARAGLLEIKTISKPSCLSISDLDSEYLESEIALAALPKAVALANCVLRAGNRGGNDMTLAVDSPGYPEN